MNGIAKKFTLGFVVTFGCVAFVLGISSLGEEFNPALQSILEVAITTAGVGGACNVVTGGPPWDGEDRYSV